MIRPVNTSNLIAVLGAIIAVASLVYAHRSAAAAEQSARSSDDSAQAAIRSAHADEVAALEQVRSGTDSGRVKVYVSLENPQRWALDYYGKEIHDLSPFEFSSRGHFEGNRLETTVRGILVNEDVRTVVVGDRWACKGGSTSLWPEPIPEPMRDHRGVRIPPGSAVIFESSIGEWTEGWRKLWVENDLERLWSHGPSTSLHVWAAQEGDWLDYATDEHGHPASGLEIRIGVYDWAFEPRPKGDPDSLIWNVRGRPSFIVTRSPYRPAPRNVHELE
jgi:hypothetical protein